MAGQPLQEEQVDFFDIVDQLVIYLMEEAVDFPYGLFMRWMSKRIIVVLDKDPDSDPDI